MTDAPKRILRAAAFAVACTAPLILHARPTAQQPPDQRPPVFRGGAYFVTVDVYPLLNGRIVDDLTLADFDVLEDGRPQKIESSESIRIEWPVLAPIDRRQARLLGRNGQPLGVPVRLSEREADGTALLVADVPLAPLAAADYVLELEAASGSRTERKLLAFRVGL